MGAKYDSIILHVGLHKTGTTSIQNESYGAHRQLLLDNGIDYPHFSYGEQHSSNHGGPVTAGIFDENDRYHAISRAGVFDDPVSVKASFKEQWDETLANPKAPNLLLSAELFSAYSEADLITLRETLLAHTDSLRVLLYVRNPVNFYGSLMQEDIKAGMVGNLAAFKDLMRGRCERLIRVFGDALEVLDFEQHVAHPDGLLAAFYAVCGVPEEQLAGIETEVYNSRASLEACRLMRAISFSYPRREANGELSKYRSHRDFQPLYLMPGNRFSVIDVAGPVFKKNVAEELEWYGETFGVGVDATMPQPSRDIWRSETVDELEGRIIRLVEPRLRQAAIEFLLEEADRPLLEQLGRSDSLRQVAANLMAQPE